MGNEKGIVILSSGGRNNETLCDILKSEGYAVFDTPSALHALSMLQREDIGFIIADRDMEDIGVPDFKSLIEKIKPGVTMLFARQCEVQDDCELSMEALEFVKLIRKQEQSKGLVGKKADEFKEFSFSVVDRLLQIFEVNDRYFFNNDHLVAELSGQIARKMELKDDDVEAIRMAALLRDIGKIGIRNDILEGAKKLNQQELAPVKEHPLHTMQLLKHVKFPWNLGSIISQHHEHYDGTGYPFGIKGRQISIGARIIAVADTYHALLLGRPYRKGQPKEIALREIRKNVGTQFDPEVVEIFLSVVGREQDERHEKVVVLIFEREQNMAALIKLCTSPDRMEVFHSQSSIDAITLMREKAPRLIIADVSALTEETFARFYEASQKINHTGKRSYLLIVPDKEYPRRFTGNVDYISKPINLDELRSTIEASLLESAQASCNYGEIKGLTGNLEDFSLADLIQILNLGVKTARAEITSDRGDGVIYIHNGKVVHASLGEMKGVQAFTELASWEKGRFRLLHGETTEEVNIKQDTMHLLLESMTLIDERRAFAGSMTEAGPAVKTP